MTLRARLGALLRRLADRLAPLPDAPEKPRKDRELGTIWQVRERQDERLAELEFLIDRNRDHDPGSGLCWFERWQLELVADLLALELEQRERELAKIAAGRP